MKKLKVSLLFYEEPDGHDVVVDQIQEVLVKQGHSTQLLGINNDLKKMLTQLDEQKPDLVFNLVETFAGVDSFDVNITALLEMTGYKFTGNDSAALLLTADKVLTKKILKFHNIEYPQFMLLFPDQVEIAANMRLPLIVKPVRADASEGISDDSVVRDWKSLVNRVLYCHDELKMGAVVEQFIPGREFFVALIGTNQPQPLPPIELDYSAMPADKLKIYGEDAKFEPDSPEYKGTVPKVAIGLDDRQRGQLAEAAVAAFHALRLSGYARVDMRMSEEGQIYILEVNANPYLERTSEVAMAAQQAGLTYEDLIQSIISSALEKYES